MLLEAKDKPVNKTDKIPWLEEETDNKNDHINEIQYFSFFARTGK